MSAVPPRAERTQRERTKPGVFSPDETADVSIDLGTPEAAAIGAEATSKFKGRIPAVTVETH